MPRDCLQSILSAVADVLVSVVAAVPAFRLPGGRMSEEGSTSRDQISAASLTTHEAVDGVVRSGSSSIPVDSRSTSVVAVKVYDDDDTGPQVGGASVRTGPRG
jgi:hypothetical protein